MVAHTDNYLDVSFDTKDVQFQYPSAFQQFITATDPDVSASIQREIAEIEATKAAALDSKRQQRIAEENARMEAAQRSEVNDKARRRHIGNTSKKGPDGKQYFFVFMNKSYDIGLRDGYLWAPKYGAAGQNVSHWRLMEDVRQGDVIFHSVSKSIVAISIASTNCYSAKQPIELKQEQEWEDEGWRVDCQYITIQQPIVTSDYMEQILVLQPKHNAPFNVKGHGNMGYLYSANHALAKFLFEKLLLKNAYLTEVAERLGM